MKITTNSEQGNFRLALILFIAMAGCLWSGGQGIYIALKNRTPTTLGYDALERGKPTVHWLVLTNCALAIHDSAYLIAKSINQTGEGRITEAYVPLRSLDEPASNRCRAVLATKDPQILSALEELRRVNNDRAHAQFLARHKKLLLQERPVEGLVRLGSEGHGEQTRLAGLKRSLSKDYIVLSEGTKPGLARSIGLVLVGLLIGAVMCFVARNGSEEPLENF